MYACKHPLKSLLHFFTVSNNGMSYEIMNTRFFRKYLAVSILLIITNYYNILRGKLFPLIYFVVTNHILIHYLSFIHIYYLNYLF